MKNFFTLTFILLCQILCAHNIEIGSIQGKITDFLIARDMEKNEMMKYNVGTKDTLIKNNCKFLT